MKNPSLLTLFCILSVIVLCNIYIARYYLLNYLYNRFSGTINLKYKNEGHLIDTNSTQLLTDDMTLCPSKPKSLVGLRKVDQRAVNVTSVEALHAEVEDGGYWKPTNCSARHRVAIIVPYRNRPQHLGVFLRHMHPFLQRQMLEYRIFLVEQSARSRFNRGMLFNIGFKQVEDMTKGHYQCYVHTDLDLLPENDIGLYSCTYDLPRHLAVNLNIYNYGNGYSSRLGGALEICKEHFIKVNGFSNLYFGWGGEDDDFRDRLRTLFPNRKTAQPFQRYNKSIARFTMLGHTKEKPNPDRFKYYTRDDYKRIPYDGLSTLNKTYSLLETKTFKLYTSFLVEIDEKKTIALFQSSMKAKSAKS